MSVPGAMLSARSLLLLRTITTLAAKSISGTSTTSSLLLYSYCDQSYHQTVYTNNRKIDASVKTGCLISAQTLFDQMPVRDVVSYNLLISGYARYGYSKQALGFYSEMVSRRVRESASTFSSVISICSNCGYYREGTQVHCRVISLGFQLNLYIGSSLMDIYMHMGSDKEAFRVFDEIPKRNLIVWNLIFRWFSELGRSSELFECYHKMEMDGICPNGLSYCYLIHGCSNKRLLDEGEQLHCQVIKVGWAESHIFVANALVDFYSACGCLTGARKSFKAVCEVDVISWNSLISVYTDHDLLLDALELFHRMQFWGKRPSIRSFVGFLNLSSSGGDILFGKQIHCYVLKMGFDYASVHVQSALIDMYGKCGDIESSLSVYEASPHRILETCNALMTSFLHCGVTEDVVEMFSLMVHGGIAFDEVTLTTTLKALSFSGCAILPSCRLLHCCAVKSGYESDVAVSCSLIDTYSRCGHVELSRQVFEKLASPNVFCFTSIINGYAQNGMGRESLEMFEALIQKGLKADKVTFLCVLTGCNYSGLVEEGGLVFSSMKSVYGMCPDRQHYSCMVDLLGRAGLLEKAEALMQHAPAKADCVMWSSLLRSCRIHKNETVGRRAAKILMELEPLDFAVCIQVSNFYSEIGEFETSLQIREIAVARKLMREIGYSSIVVNGCN